MRGRALGLRAVVRIDNSEGPHLSLAAAVDVSLFPSRPIAGTPSVLIAEDERKLRGWLTDQFLGLGIVPMTAASGYEAIRIVGESRPDLILLDGLLPQM